MIVAVACLCGNSENLIRGALRRYGYQDFLNIPVTKGKEKSISLLSSLPQFPEIRILQEYISHQSKFAVILGYNEDKCRWADIAGPSPKEAIEAELIVQHFA